MRRDAGEHLPGPARDESVALRSEIGANQRSIAGSLVPRTWPDRALKLVAAMAAGVVLRFSLAIVLGGVPVDSPEAVPALSSDPAEIVDASRRILRRRVQAADGGEVAAGPETSPSATLDVETPAVSEPTTIGEAELRRLHDLYLSYGREDYYRKLVDDLPARPLGLTESEYEAWLRRAGRRSGLAESRVSALNRLSALNAAIKSPFAAGEFALLALRQAENLSFAVGKGADFRVSEPEDMAASLVRRHSIGNPAVARLGPMGLDEVVRLCEARIEQRERTRRDIWRVVSEAAGNAAPISGRTVSAVLIQDGVVHVVPRGDDPELERRLDVLASLRASLRAQLRFSSR